MEFTEFDIVSENINPFDMIGKQWCLVSAGNENGFNMMTASWGGMGVMWNKNVVTTVIRPQRYTKKFMDSSDIFTVSFYPEACRKALQFCGSHSGIDCDNKAAEAGLTPKFIDGTVAFEEAETILVCRKLFVQKLTEDGFIDKSLIESCYPGKDYHYAYVAEIIKAYKK